MKSAPTAVAIWQAYRRRAQQGSAQGRIRRNTMTVEDGTKVSAHLMFGILALSAGLLMRLREWPPGPISDRPRR